MVAWVKYTLARPVSQLHVSKQARLSMGQETLDLSKVPIWQIRTGRIAR